jgi:thiamine-phosphate pyrophosphorylase
MVKIADPRVILVTDPAFGDDAIATCVRLSAGALPRGAFAVQLRDKRRPVISLRLFALALRALTRDCGAFLVVNGMPEIARDVGADGVHLGRGAPSVREVRGVCGAQAWVSVAAHSDEAVGAAVEAGADAVLVSPVFPTHPPRMSSVAKEARGVGAVRAARAIAGGRVAVYALGGVSGDNAGACGRAGADGVAVIRALLCSPHPARVARALHDAVAARC